MFYNIRHMVSLVAFGLTQWGGRSFALMQKNQKIKASSASLLAPCTPLFASQLALCAQTAMLSGAPFRSFA